MAAIAAAGAGAPIGEPELGRGNLPNGAWWSLDWWGSFGSPLEVRFRLTLADRDIGL